MTTDDTETSTARLVLARASWYAIQDERPADREAAAVAILVRALELATPDLSPERRAGLFLGCEE